MGLEKAIEHGKEKRKPYRGAKRFDKTCRNHGACSWCEGNRRHNERVEKERAYDREKEYMFNWKEEI